MANTNNPDYFFPGLDEAQNISITNLCNVLRILNDKISTLQEDNRLLRKAVDEFYSDHPGHMQAYDNQTNRNKYNVNNKKEVNEVFIKIFRKSLKPLDLEDVMEVIEISYQYIVPPHILDSRDFIRRKLVKACEDQVVRAVNGNPGKKGCFYVLGSNVDLD